MDVKEALATYELTIYHLSEETQIWYMGKLKVFTAWCEGQDIPLEKVSPVIVKRFLDERKKTINPRTGLPLSSDAVHGYGRVVKLFLKWCSKDEMYSEYVSTRTVNLIAVPKVEQKVVEIFEAEEIAALFKACSKEYHPSLVSRDTAILSVLFDCGTRASEICELAMSNVHLSKEDSYIKIMGKGGKEREIGLGDKARLAVHRYIRGYRTHARPTDVVFLSRFHKPLTINGLDQLLYRLRDWAHLTVSAGAHKFRHTMAVNYLLAGGDVYKLSRLLGHTSVVTTERYVRAMKSRDARKGLSVLDNL
jgi:site-specific recombinase XerD